MDLLVGFKGCVKCQLVSLSLKFLNEDKIPVNERDIKCQDISLLGRWINPLSQVKMPSISSSAYPLLVYRVRRTAF